MRFTRFSQLLLVAGIAGSMSANAFDLSLLKNDKEAKSRAYTNFERKMAEKNASANSAKAFQILGETMNELEKVHAECDFPLYQSFTGRLKAAGLPTSTRSIVNLLIVWRSQNLIDDVFFEIMEQVVNLGEARDLTSIDRIRNREVSKGESLLKQKNITTQDLMALYEGFKGATVANPGCSVSGWTRVGPQIASISKKSDTARVINAVAKNQGIIDEDQFKLVEFYRLNDVQSWDITLGKYLSILKNAKNRARAGVATEADLKTNVLSSKLKDKKSGVTYRQSLYYRFNSTQISMISDVLKKTFERMDATKTEVVFTFKTGSETIPVSPMGQYYLARRLLLKDITELSRTSFFNGAKITHEDLVAAALETGLINSEILDSVLKIDDIWNPEVKPWTKVANFAFRITGTATIFLPPPYNVISSIALVLVEGVIHRKSVKASQAGSLYDFF